MKIMLFSIFSFIRFEQQQTKSDYLSGEMIFVYKLSKLMELYKQLWLYISGEPPLYTQIEYTVGLPIKARLPQVLGLHLFNLP